jgi:NAD(P)-dependent dehydrogenase (short-subunit alcohol dehydrogenase family)
MTGTPVIVGGGSGMGAALAASYWSTGARPLIWDIAGEPDIVCDISDPAAVDAAVAQTIERIGVPDQLTITAGVGHSGTILNEPIESWDRIFAINTRGPWLVMRAMARAMIDAEVAGSIVVTSSVSAHLPDRAMATYCASKAALNMVVQVAACEWAPHGIRVNAVAPGVTDTPILKRAPLQQNGWVDTVRAHTPLGRLGESEDIAEAILALHGLGWVTGQILDCDGGLALHSPIDTFGEAQKATAQ